MKILFDGFTELVMNQDLDSEKSVDINLKIDEFIRISSLLLEDTIICAGGFEIDINNPDQRQFWRRSFVRSLFAAIEGLTFQYKQLAKEIAKYNRVEFSSSEIALLNDESYVLNNKGEASVQEAKLKTVENMLFSLFMLAKSCKREFAINKGTEWDAFLKTRKIRDRITHPKKLEHVRITIKEVSTIRTAVIWIVNSVNGQAIEFIRDFQASQK
ncbi:MAG TPA: hypothetical protein VF571_06555 [Pyrinomonadaceae bacterium]